MIVISTVSGLAAYVAFRIYRRRKKCDFCGVRGAAVRIGRKEEQIAGARYRCSSCGKAHIRTKLP